MGGVYAMQGVRGSDALDGLDRKVFPRTLTATSSGRTSSTSTLLAIYSRQQPLLLPLLQQLPHHLLGVHQQPTQLLPHPQCSSSRSRRVHSPMQHNLPTALVLPLPKVLLSQCVLHGPLLQPQALRPSHPSLSSTQQRILML